MTAVKNFLDCTIAFLLFRNACDGFIVLASTRVAWKCVHHATSCLGNHLLYPAVSIDLLATTLRSRSPMCILYHLRIQTINNFVRPILTILHDYGCIDVDPRVGGDNRIGGFLR